MVRDRSDKDAKTVSAILLAAGKGERLGGVAKAQLPGPNGHSLLESDIAKLRALVDELIVGIDPTAPTDWCAKIPDVVLSKGGTTRMDTLRNALELATGAILLVWDVARPYVQLDTVSELLYAADKYGAAMPVLRFRTRESLGVEKDGWLVASFPRYGLFLSQTPQAFQRDIIQAALARAPTEDPTEISLHSLVNKAGYRVRLIEGSRQNRKITFPEDLEAYLHWQAKSYPANEG